MTKRLTTEQLEEIRKRAELVSKGGLLTNMDVIPNINEMAQKDVPALLGEVERLRKIVAWSASCVVCVNQLGEGWKYDDNHGELICDECFDNRYGGDVE